MNNHKTLLERIKEHLSILKAILLEVKSICLLVVVVAILVDVLIHIVQHPGDLNALSALKPVIENVQAIKLIP